MTPKRYVGIDYSMNSPAICISDASQDFSFRKCLIYFMTPRQKFIGDKSLLAGCTMLWGMQSIEAENQQDRFFQIASWARRHLDPTDRVVIEDYSMGSKGKVFHIAENTGLLKHVLWQAQIPFTTVPPTVLKKFATGKGNANKEAMYQAFTENEKGPDLIQLFGENRVTSPISDIVDAFFFAKYARSLA